MKAIYSITLSAIALFTMACSGGSQARMLFKSGFEGEVYIDPIPVKGSEDFAYIRGKDTESGYSWPWRFSEAVKVLFTSSMMMKETR